LRTGTTPSSAVGQAQKRLLNAVLGFSESSCMLRADRGSPDDAEEPEQNNMLNAVAAMMSRACIFSALDVALFL
jgi:hypothetical protein